MSTITLPNIRVGSDLQIRVRLKDGGVAIDWSTLSNIKACIYSDAQRALAGRCAFSIDEEDNTLLVCTYAANKPQYLGVNRIVISAKYMGETKTYDKPAFSFVRWTADQEGEEITIDDPDVDVEIDVEDVSSSILQEAVDAAFSAADRANEAAAAAEHMVDIHTGPEGKSAYEVAVEEGYTGTEEEWLASLKGDTGETPDISIGTVTTVEPGTPAAASMTGTPEAPVLNLSIPQGVVGATPNFTVGTVTTGEPGSSVIVTITGTPEAPVLNVTIPQGMQGNTGSSVDYPYELVNNLTTNDSTKGLSAAQGVVLDGKVSQLEAEVNGIPGGDTELERTDAKAQKLLKTDGTLASASSPASIVAEFSGGPGQYKITGRVGTTSGVCLVVFYDANNNVLAYYNESTGTATPYQDAVVTAPAGTAYLRVAGNTTQNYNAKAIFFAPATEGLTDKVEDLEDAVSDVNDVVVGDTIENTLTPTRTASRVVLNATDGTDLTSSGNNSVVYDFAVSEGLTYKVSGRVGTTANTCLAVFMNGDTFISSHIPTTGTATPYLNVEITAPAGANRLRVAGNSVNDYAPAVVEVSTDGLTGDVLKINTRLNVMGAGLASRTFAKTVGVFGGSVSVRAESETAKTIWKKVCGVSVTSYGVSGAGFSSLQGTSIQTQVDGAASKDIYILWASTNDFRNDRECGTWKDYTAEDNFDESKRVTQCGGINYCIKKLLTTNPKADIFFFTPMRFFSDESGYNPFSESTNATGKTFAEYVSAMKECCSHYGIPVLDQFNLQGVNEFNYTNYYNSDNVHPTVAGYEKIGYAQAAFLLNES